jgi:polar amino acid transport system substrate-binding protein
LLALLFAAHPATAETLARIKAAGVLVWGGDQEGGAPYVYPRPDDKSRVTGFEVDLAAKLAAALGVRAQFFQGPWDQMPSLLETRKVDIVMNGYEWTPARAEAMGATIPYYVYGLQLLVRRGNTAIGSLDDLRKPGPSGKLRVGILSGSGADAYMRAHFGRTVEIVSYDGNTDAMGDVVFGRLDATLQDTPIVSYYGPRYPQLVKVGRPVGHGDYVILTHKEDKALVAALNAALIRLYRDGTLERIYRRYGVWDDAQARLAPIMAAGKYYGYAKDVLAPPDRRAPDLRSPDRGSPDLRATNGTGAGAAQGQAAAAGGWDSVLVLVEAAGMTVVLTFLSFPLAIALGLLIALGRLHGPGWLRPPLAVYVEFLRGTPLLMQLYFVFFFLPVVGVNVPAFWTAIVGLAINYSAYESEIYRAGLQAVPRGQFEAAMALGMSRPLALKRVVVPQAVRIVIPPVINDLIALFKDTSVCSVITVVELTKQFSILSRSDPAQIAWLMAVTALLYILMSYPTSLAARYVERRVTAPLAATARGRAAA